MRKFFYTIVLFFTLFLGEGFACHLTGLTGASSCSYDAATNTSTVMVTVNVGITDFVGAPSSFTINANTVGSGCGSVSNIMLTGPTSFGATVDLMPTAFLDMGACECGTTSMGQFTPGAITSGNDLTWTGTASGTSISYDLSPTITDYCDLVCAAEHNPYGGMGVTAPTNADQTTATAPAAGEGLTFPLTFTVSGNFCCTGNTVAMVGAESAQCPNASEPAVITFTVMPVELLYFTGGLRSNVKEFVWETANEVNNDYFVLEGSDDGITFKEVDIINSKGLSGNSQKNLLYKYAFKDNNGYAFFRLKQVDFDGKFAYSSIIRLKDGSNKLSIDKLIPRSDILDVTFTNTREEQTNFCIVDLSGRIINCRTFSSQEGQNVASMEISNLPSGFYFVKLNGIDGVDAKKFFKH